MAIFECNPRCADFSHAQLFTRFKVKTPNMSIRHISLRLCPGQLPDMGITKRKEQSRFPDWLVTLSTRHANTGLFRSVDLTTGADGLGQVLEDVNGGFPVDASVGDADTGLQGGGALSGDLLVTPANVGLDHDTNNGLLALAELFANRLGNLGLVKVVLLGVA